MKSALLTLSFGFIISAFFIGISPQSKAEVKINQTFTTANTKELILQINEMNEKNLPQIRNGIEANGGMTFKGYCMKLKVVMYDVDPNIHPDYSFLNPVFMNLSIGYVIKTGTIYQVDNACGVNPVGDPTQSGQ